LHFAKFGGKYTPIVGIDFMRCCAHATGACAGIDDAVFSGTPKGADFVATVIVWRLVQGQRCSFAVTARWSEYRPSSDHMWQKMPHLMLGKTAEALALRRAFPAELSGTFVAEELDQASDDGRSEGVPTPGQPSRPLAAQSPDVELPAPAPRKRDEYRPISTAQKKKLFTMARDKQWPLEALRARLLERFGHLAHGRHSRRRLRRSAAHHSQRTDVGGAADADTRRRRRSVLKGGGNPTCEARHARSHTPTWRRLRSRRS
jgi:hypothetical protein